MQELLPPLVPVFRPLDKLAQFLLSGEVLTKIVKPHGGVIYERVHMTIAGVLLVWVSKLASVSSGLYTSDGKRASLIPVVR